MMEENKEYNIRNIQMHFFVTEKEAALIDEHMEQSGIPNLSAYLRKMAIDGYVINLDMSDFHEIARLLRYCSNNLNQYAKKANATGSIYKSDIDDLRGRLDMLWDGMRELLLKFASIQ